MVEILVLRMGRGAVVVAFVTDVGDGRAVPVVEEDVAVRGGVRKQLTVKVAGVTVITGGRGCSGVLIKNFLRG